MRPAAGIVVPGLRDHCLQVRPQPRMHFVHVADHAFGALGLAHAAQVARVFLINICLQQPAPARLSVCRMPHLEILVRRAESVEALVLPVTADDLECGPHHRAVVQTVNHPALLRWPLRGDRDVPQDAKRNGADRGLGFHVTQQARLPVRDAHPVLAALDVFHGAAIANHVAQFRCESPRELVVATLDLRPRFSVMAVGVADEVQRCVVLKAEQHVMDCVLGRASLPQEIRHADVSQPGDLRWPVLADAVTDVAHDSAVIVFVKVGEADPALLGREVERHLRHVYWFSYRHLHPLALQQSDFRQVLGEERLQLQPEVLYPLPRNTVCIGNASGAGFGIEIVGKALADGVDSAAGMELRLQNDDLVPGILQFPSRRQPRQPRGSRHACCFRAAAMIATATPSSGRKKDTANPRQLPQA